MGTELDKRCEGAELLRTALYTTNITLPTSSVQLLARHLDLVIDKNRSVNLTRIDSFEDGAYLHVADSLLLMSAFDRAPRGAFVDVGTGAGYPGIPLAVATGRKALLVDSVGKKAAAVSEFVHELGIDKQVEVSNARIEEVGRTRRSQFAVVTARAVAQTNVLVEYAAPLLKSGGHLVVAKAHVSTEELDAANRAALVCGLKIVSRETFELPDGRGHREVLSYERVRNPSIKLPRAVGMAQHHPLGL